MKLNEIRPAKGAVRDRKRVGRGTGSGQSGTAGKGHKGEQARSGRAKRKAFEGGQMQLTRRLPKFGFTNPFRVEYQVVNVGQLEAFDVGSEIGPEVLGHAGRGAQRDWLRLLRRRRSALQRLVRAPGVPGRCVSARQRDAAGVVVEPGPRRGPCLLH